MALHELSCTGVLGWKWKLLVGRTPFLIGRGFDKARSQIKRFEVVGDVKVLIRRRHS